MDKIKQAVDKAERAAIRAKLLEDMAKRMEERERRREELEKAVAEYRIEKMRNRDMKLIDRQFNRIRYLRQLDAGEPTVGRMQIRLGVVSAIQAHAPFVAEAQARLMADGIVPITIDNPPGLLE